MKSYQGVHPALVPPLGMKEPLLITTSTHATPALEARARQVAAQCAVPYSPRNKTVSRMRREYGVELVYVVRSDREEVKGPNHSLFVHPGMFSLKRKDGLQHPLLRALSPKGDPPLDTVIDATLGLGGDAFHMAGLLLPRRIIGIERSPVLHALLQEGIPRLAAQKRGWSEGAKRLELRYGDATEVLRTLDDKSADVVFLDPMFDTPAKADGTFYLLRRLANHESPQQALLDEACRVARRRVVWKLPAAIQPPAHLKAPGPGWNRRVRGLSVDYSVIDFEF